MTALHTLELPGQVDLAAMQAARPDRYPALFRTTGTDLGWDILFGFPQQIDRFSLADGLAALRQHPAMQLQAGGAAPDAVRFHSALPFTGGWLAFFAYELGELLEPRVQRSEDGGQRTGDIGQKTESSETPQDAATDFPVAWLARIPLAILQQPASGRTVLMVETAHLALREAALRDLQTSAPLTRGLPVLQSIHEEIPERFLRGVASILDYIRAGDVFQANLSRGWRAKFAGPVNPAALFATLMEVNPAPFAALLQWDQHTIISSSPERLVSVGGGGTISTRPIAGTHPRGATRAEDDKLRARLATHPKERAEHVMLVDLERNDLGRVCEPGSVHVDALMDITDYQFVHHIESTISGLLKPEVCVFDVLRAVFPGGTITGCPKVRTMQIIRELEPSPREAYTGSLGYINHNGSLDFNILIRSFQLRGAELRFRAGAGIVADSEATRELAETRAKARGLLRTLGLD